LRDGTVELWDVQREEKDLTFRALTGGLGDPSAGGVGSFDLVHHFAFSRDGKTLATGGNGNVRLWEPGIAQTSPHSRHKAITTWVEFSPDGQRLATVANGSPRLWDLAPVMDAPGRRQPARRTGDRVFARRQVDRLRRRQRLDHDAEQAAAVRRPDGQTGWRTTGPRGRHLGTGLFPDGKSLASADANGRVKVWAARPAPCRRAAGRWPADQLVDQLIKAQRSDAQVVEGLFSPRSAGCRPTPS